MLETLFNLLLGRSVSGGLLANGTLLTVLTIAGLAYLGYRMRNGRGPLAAVEDLKTLGQRATVFLQHAKSLGLLPMLGKLLADVSTGNWAALPGDAKEIFDKFDTPEERTAFLDHLAQAQVALILKNPERKAALEEALGITITPKG
jgi:hypothetical protein